MTAHQESKTWQPTPRWKYKPPRKYRLAPGRSYFLGGKIVCWVIWEAGTITGEDSQIISVEYHQWAWFNTREEAIEELDYLIRRDRRRP